MSDRPAVSVVVSTRNRSARLEALVGSLRAQTLAEGAFELVVVDDGSIDDTAALLDRERGRPGLDLKVVSRPTPGGPARARNHGWRAARAPIIAFTDDDCEPSAQWLEEGLRACRGRPGAIVQGCTRPLPREMDRLGPFSRTIEIERAGPFFETCNIFYPRRTLERLDGFDEAFSAPGGEDSDLGWRALEIGDEVVYAQQALVYHAVDDLRPSGHLRVALRWSDAMLMFRHEGLRQAVLTRGIFWKRSHALLLDATIGAVLAPRCKLALVLAIPYARALRARCRQWEAPLALAPYFVVHDVLETYAAVRGAARHRVLVI